MPAPPSLSSAFRLIPNPDWPEIIDRLLGSDTTAEAETARITMWTQVQHYVLRVALLPIGPLRDDPEARRDIAIGVMHRLEMDDHRHLRDWRERQAGGRRRKAAWWTLISLITKQVAIDVGRAHENNMAQRGEPFVWAALVPVDPTVLDEVQQDGLEKAVEFLDQAESERLGYVTALAENLGCNLDGEPTKPPLFLPVTPQKRK